MSLRTRLAVAAGVAVAVTAAGVAVGIYVAARGELRRQVDRALAERAEYTLIRPLPRSAEALGPPLRDFRGPAPTPFGGANGYRQFVYPDGRVRSSGTDTVPLPVSAATRAVAAGREASFYEDVTIRDNHLRVLTAHIPRTEGVQGVAVQVAESLDEVDSALARLLAISAAICAAGIAMAVAIGAVVSRTALAPVARFTKQTETITGDPDLSHRLDVVGDDELARLARSFNATLDALEQSVDAQRRLVADASHELRTPIASLRTNIQVLAISDGLPADERRQLIADVVEELDELTALVGDVVELARGSGPADFDDEVRLDEVTSDAIDRARRRAPTVRFDVDLERAVVYGMPDRINRAVTNLVDNAIKWSPPDGTVEVAVRGDEIRVRDHGPGFDPADLPFVFNRFYRAGAARKMPGSGLGLAIVRQVAEAHGGTVSAENADGGGALLRVTFASDGRDPDAPGPGARPEPAALS